PPFEAPSLQGLLVHVFFGAPVPPSQRQPGLDPGLDAICLKAMQKKKEERYRSMAEFAAALARYLPGGGGRSGPGSDPLTLPTGADPALPSGGVLHIDCPHCGQKLRLPAAALGKRMKCPRCQNAVQMADALPVLPTTQVPPVPVRLHTPPPLPSGAET